MEQEVPVTMHKTMPKSAELPEEKKSYASPIATLGGSLSELVSNFKESEAGELLQKGTEQTKEYIKNNPTQAMLMSLGAGALLGVLMGRRR